MRTVIARSGFGAALLAALVFGPGRADAGFLGHTIHSEYYTPDLNTKFDDEGTKTVSPTATFIAMESVNGTPTPFLQATFTDTNLKITSVYPFGSQVFYGGGGFNGFSFTDTSGNIGVTGVSVDSANNISGYAVTLQQGRLLVNLGGLTFPTTGVISLNFTPATVPEPGSLALCGVAGAAGLGVVGLRRRRARTATSA